jgi:hypothetical protein
MVNDNSIQLLIEKQLIADNAERDAKHESSGLLSASWLYQPTRFQVMKTIGVPRKTFEPYLLGKFKRGFDVEQWLVDHMEKAGILVEKQKEVKYRNVIGFIDAVVDSDKLMFKKGKMPHEVKSVTNAKLARIAKSTEIDHHYKLQAGLYAIAEKSEYYAVDIISAEDLRVNTYIFQTSDIAPEIEQIISNYDKALEVWKTMKRLPELVVNEKVKWAINPDYAPFPPEWLAMTDEQIVKELSK